VRDKKIPSLIDEHPWVFFFPQILTIRRPFVYLLPAKHNFPYIGRYMPSIYSQVCKHHFSIYKMKRAWVDSDLGVHLSVDGINAIVVPLMRTRNEKTFGPVIVNFILRYNNTLFAQSTCVLT